MQQKSVNRASMWLFLGILLISTNLRAPFTSVAPLLPQIGDYFHLNSICVGLIQMLPLLAFALFSPCVPALGRHYGLSNVLFVALVVITAGILWRSLGGLWGLYGGTLLLGLGIAAGNVLLPSLLKRDFAGRTGRITSWYVLAMSLAAAVGSAVMVPLAQYFQHWSWALLSTLCLPLLALLVWWRQWQSEPHAMQQHTEMQPLQHNIWTVALAWQVSLFFGLNSLIYYIVVAWLPALLQSMGLSAATAGTLHGILQLAGAIPGLFMGMLLARLCDQRWLAAGCGLLSAVGLVGLWLLPSLAVVWVICLGFSTGVSVILGLAFIGLRAGHASAAAALSGMAQSVAYLLAAGGPPLAGWLHDRFGGWQLLLAVCMVLALIQAVAGYLAGRARQID
ncbi:MFS transporter [Neisseriaceae bacterium ESL0693]|nr:MFS transporter [Neisseriaceae bacterium ESL0693]